MSQLSHKVIYEQPLNERVRTFLRLELLFQEIRHHLGGTSAFDTRAAISNLLDIMSIFGRSDIKTEVMKELDRHAAKLENLSENPEVDSIQLNGLLEEMEGLIDELHALGGPVGHHLKTNEFLTSIQQRSSIPGGTCDFDLPAYHFWLQQPPEDRIRDLISWLESFDVIGRSIRLVLRLTRGSTLFRPHVASGGFYQQSLDPNVPCQMVRVAVPAGSPWFAEISGGRHRFTVRFLSQPTADERAAQTSDDVAFDLACCIL